MLSFTPKTEIEYREHMLFFFTSKNREEKVGLVGFSNGWIVQLTCTLGLLRYTLDHD